MERRERPRRRATRSLSASADTFGANSDHDSGSDDEWLPEEVPQLPPAVAYALDSDSDVDIVPDDPAPVAQGPDEPALPAQNVTPAANLNWLPTAIPRNVLPFQAQAGGNVRVPRGNRLDPLTMWKKFVGDDLLAVVVRETNRYAGQLKVMPRPNTAREDDPWPPKFLTTWKNLTIHELKAFFGLTYAFGVHKLPAIRDYWNQTEWLFQTPHLAKVMPRARYEAIKRCLHFVNNEDEAFNREDPFVKVRPLLTRLLERSKVLYQPGENLAIDEQMQRCNSRYCAQVYRPKRKKTDGLKIWSICESGTGYMAAFCLAYRGQGRIEDTVMNLVSDLASTRHKLYMDNLFASRTLFQRLLHVEQYACGTWRANYGMPLVLKPANIRGLARGDFLWRMTGEGLLGIAWHDTKVCNFLSSWHSPTDTVVYRRQRGVRGRVERAAPTVAADYNANMGGVDQVDSLRASYTTQQPCRRWYLALLYWWLDMTAIQSMIVYRSSVGAITHVKYLGYLVEGLIREGAGEGVLKMAKKRRRRSLPPVPSRGLPYANVHTPVRMQGRKRCAHCSNSSTGGVKRGSYQCSGCGAYLHRRCFGPYHLAAHR